MARHYSDIGLIINEYDYCDELNSIIEEYAESSRTVSVGENSYLIVDIDEKVELWFRVIEGETDLDSVEPHYRSGLVSELINPEWVYRDDLGMSGLLKGKLNNEPINLNISGAALVPPVNSLASLRCEIAAFAESLSVYEDVEDFKENCEYGDAFAEKAYIPTGCYDSFGKDEINQTPRAIISGVVKSVEQRENSHTGEEYFVITVESAHSNFVMLVEPELLYDDVVPGNIIMGKFWFSGKVLD